jgi:hypothetical protein
MKIIAFLIIGIISADLYGQGRFNETFENFDYIDYKCGIFYTRDAKFCFYPDSAFLFLQLKRNYDALIESYSSGQYSLHNDTIILTSLKNDSNLVQCNYFERKHKNGRDIIPENSGFNDFSEKKLFLDNGTLKADTLLGYFDSFYSNRLKKKIGITVNCIIPFNISPSKSDLLIKPKDSTFYVYQKTGKYTHPFGPLKLNDTILIMDVDSSIFIVKSYKYRDFLKPDTIIYSKHDKLEFTLKYSTIPHESCPNDIIKAVNIGDLDYSFGVPVNIKTYVKEHTGLSTRKCLKMLLNSNLFEGLKVSYSDSIELKYQPNQIFELMNMMGIRYVNEIFTKYKSPFEKKKYKRKNDYLISMPGFSNDKLFALITIQSIKDKETSRTLLFERRIYDYELIGELTDNELNLKGKSYFIEK